MPSALLRKEWNQLATLRWVGLSLGLMFPLLLLASAEVARQGWLPLQRVNDYSTATLFLEIHPILMLALAALVALLVSCQCFSGDRAAGTETFLLERPVRRSAIWRSRALASFLTSVVVVVGHLAIWWLFARDASDDGVLWSQTTHGLAVGLPVTVLVCLIAGIAAASVLDSPMQALMLALVMGAAAVGLGALATALFPYARLHDVSAGSVISVVLLAGYLLASFFMLCRGEPAGRGRWIRGAVILLASAVLAPVGLAIATPLVTKLETNRFVDGVELTPSPGGDLALVLNRSNWSGWLLDTSTGKRLHFFGPPVFQGTWNRDGSRLAVFHASGPLGSISSRVRVEFFDQDGGRIGQAAPRAMLHMVDHTRWAGDKLVVREVESRRRSALCVISPETGEVKRFDIELGSHAWKLLGPDARGDLYVLRAHSNDWPANDRLSLERFDVERAAVDPQPLFEEEGFASPDATSMWNYELSPRGRYLHRGNRRMIDLTSGEEIAVAGNGWTGWLEDDRFVWIDRSADGSSSLYRGRPGAEPEFLRRWPAGTLTVAVSPDRARLLVRVYDFAEGGKEVGREDGVAMPGNARQRETWLFTVEENRWADVSDWIVADLPYAEQRVDWASPTSLAYSGEGWLTLRSTDPADPSLRIAGHPPAPER